MDNTKIQYSAMVALAFVVLSHPTVYRFTDKWARQLIKKPLAENGCPNKLGLIVHGLVAGALVYYLLNKQYLVPRPLGL